MKQRVIFCAVALVFIATACLVVRGFLRSRSGTEVPVKSMKTWQQADAPLGFPLNAGAKTPGTDQFAAPVLPPFDARFIQLSAFERALLPTAAALSAPMGSVHGALTYNAQPFWSLNDKRGGHHTGDDFNGIGGMNTDLGDPVYAVANGLVIYSGEPSKGWGNTLMLAHRTPDGAVMISMYAHLDRIRVAIGSVVARGAVIGTVGTANLNYPAHLHLEMHDSSGVHIGPGYTGGRGDRLDPSALIAGYRPEYPGALFISPFALVKAEQQADRYRGLKIRHRTTSDK